MTTDTIIISEMKNIKKENFLEIKSKDNKKTKNNNHSDGRWNLEEHMRFIKGCLLYGNNWKKIEGYVETRTSTQIRSHAQKFLIKLKKKYDSYDDNKDYNNINIKNDDYYIKDDIFSILNYLNSNSEIESQMEKIEKILLKIFKINRKNGDIYFNKKINPSNLINKKIFKCEKEIKKNQLKNKIWSWLNSNEKEDLDNLIKLININDEKINFLFQNIFQSDEIYRQINNN